MWVFPEPVSRAMTMLRCLLSSRSSCWYARVCTMRDVGASSSVSLPSLPEDMISKTGGNSRDRVETLSVAWIE